MICTSLLPLILYIRPPTLYSLYVSVFSSVRLSVQVSGYHTPVADVSAGVYSYIRQLNDIDLDLDPTVGLTLSASVHLRLRVCLSVSLLCLCLSLH